MNSLRLFSKIIPLTKTSTRPITVTTVNKCKDWIDFPEETVKIPEYQDRTGESIEVQRARVLYQARKRGTLENGLLFSTFAAKYIKLMDAKQLQDFDRLLNKPGNEWDIYYWAVGTKPTPKEYDHEIMAMFKEHVQNNDREMRIRQPDLC